MATEPDTPLDLFADGYAEPRRETLGPGAVLLHAFASSRAAALLAALEEVVQRSPFRCMTTPGGYRMSGRHDQLRGRGLGHGPQRLSLRRSRPIERRMLARDAAGVPGTRG